jgi:hypothetical protein
MIFDLTVSAYIRNLTHLKGILEKAKAWQVTSDFKDEALCNAHLAINQFSFARQVQMTADYAKRGGAILCGIEAPNFEDNEKTIDELQIRIDKTIDFLKTLTPDMVKDDLETRLVPFTWVPGKGFTAKFFVEQYALPNFYFHYVTAYSILRNFGLAVGKGDYMSIELVDLA